MKTIPLSRAIEILDSAMAIQVDGNALIYPDLNPENESEDIFLVLSSNDIYESFSSIANATVSVNSDGALILVNTRGEPTIVMPLCAKPADSLPRIIVVIEGGVVSSVYADQSVNLDILDRDDLESLPREDEAGDEGDKQRRREIEALEEECGDLSTVY